MTDPARVAPVTFRATRGQRRTARSMGIFFVVFGIIAIAAAVEAGKNSVSLIAGGVVLILFGILLFRRRNPETTIDADGVHTWSGFGKRSISWSEIKDIDIKFDSGDGDTLRHVRIRPHHGRSFRLPAPVDSNDKGGQNPDFYVQYATIRSHWESAISASPGEPQDPTPGLSVQPD